MSTKRNDAKRLMKTYLRFAVKANGGTWNTENDAEIDYLVDCLIDAAKDELAAEMFDSGEQFLIIHPEDQPL